MNFGNRIKLARTRLRLKQEDLATSLGVTRETIARYESEKQNITITQLAKIAETLQVPASWFLEEESEFVPGHNLPPNPNAPVMTAKAYPPIKGRSASKQPGGLSDALRELDQALNALAAVQMRVAKAQAKIREFEG